MVIYIIEPWMIILGLSNLILLISSIVIFLPKESYKTPITTYYQYLLDNSKYLLIILIIVSIHLIEVNLLDLITTSWIKTDFTASFQLIENGYVYWFSQNWSQPLLVFFVFIYIVLYPFTLWFTPLYCIITNNKKAIKTLAYSLVGIYSIALPFYLFMPITNVYTYYGTQSALNTVIPTIEQFFYSTTTYNNCFPSLHVAMTIIIANTASKTQNKKYTYFTYITAILVIIAVIYLSIHWLLDVIAGILLAITSINLIKYLDRKKKNE